MSSSRRGTPERAPRRRGSARLAGLLAISVSATGAACNLGGHGKGAPLPADGGGLDASPWNDPSTEAEPRPGMVWIPPGVLIAGTPPDRLPRVADEEMAGEQVVMHGFYVDVFPYPDEAGAIPSTNVSRLEAIDLCTAQQKRLCTELELERACKGPANLTYEYGDTYRAGPCGTGVQRSLIPNGYNAACQSAFGVHDLHGGVWSWTASEWKRDTDRAGTGVPVPSARANVYAVRGGNGVPGELLGRCANGRGVKTEARREDVGVRCCAGEPNTFEVVLSVTRGEPLRWQAPDDHLAPQLEKLVPEDVLAAGEGGRPDERFHLERLWTWHPRGNDELLIGGGCARPGEKERARCGVVIARMRSGAVVSLAWVSTDWWQPTLSEAETPRELFLMGGDRNGAFRRRVSDDWGRISVADKERKRRRKGYKEPTY